MEDCLIHLPDKIVADDIKNFLHEKTDKHLFSDIYKGRTSLSPNFMIKYGNADYSDVIYLYEGGLGMGNYHSVVYSIKQQNYIYYTINANEKPHEIFKCENWKEFYTHVRKELIDMFVLFNP